MAEVKTKEHEHDEGGVAATLEEDDLGDQALLELAKHFWFKIFLVISVGLAILEPFLVAFPETTYPVQVIVLALSTFLFLFGYVATMVAMPEGSVLERFKDAFLPELWIEVVCFIIGWSLIFRDPAMAAFRCFRIFRFVWYSEFYRAKKKSLLYPLTFFCHTVLQYLEKLGEELFTTSSKGGLVVLGFFFYMAYIFGCAFFQSTASFPLISPEGGNQCDTLPHCFLIMLRVTFFDGSGFDYLKSLIDNGNNDLVALLILYMCISAFVLLNGMIGIFGGAFASATEEVDQAEETMKAIERVEEMCKQLESNIAALKSD